MQIIIDKSEYDELLKYKAAVESNGYLIKYNSWGMDGTLTMAHSATRDEAVEAMTNEIKRLRAEVKDLSNGISRFKNRKWWQCINQ